MARLDRPLGLGPTLRGGQSRTGLRGAGDQRPTASRVVEFQWRRFRQPFQLGDRLTVKDDRIGGTAGVLSRHPAGLMQSASWIRYSGAEGLASTKRSTIARLPPRFASASAVAPVRAAISSSSGRGSSAPGGSPGPSRRNRRLLPRPPPPRLYESTHRWVVRPAHGASRSCNAGGSVERSIGWSWDSPSRVSPAPPVPVRKPPRFGTTSALRQPIPEQSFDPGEVGLQTRVRRVGLAHGAKDLAGSLEDRGHRGFRSVIGYAGCPVADGPCQLVDELRVVRVGRDSSSQSLRAWSNRRLASRVRPASWRTRPRLSHADASSIRNRSTAGLASAKAFSMATAR